MAEPDVTLCIDDEHPGKLTNIALGKAHAMPPGQSRQAFDSHADREERPCRGLFELESGKQPLLRIGNHGERDIEAGFKISGFPGAPQTDEYHVGPDPLKLVCMAAQLRHLFPAKRSPVMPQENQHQWPVFPEATQMRGRLVPQNYFLILHSR